MDFLGVQGFPVPAGTGNGKIPVSPCREQEVLPRAKRVQHRRRTTPQPPIAARSRPAASPALPLVTGLSITRRHRPGTLFLPPGSPAPRHIQQSALSSRSTSSAPRLTFLGGRAVRRGQTREQSRQTLLNLKPGSSRVSASSRAHTALHAPAASRACAPRGSVGRSPCCATTRRAAGQSGALSPQLGERPAAALWGHCACAPLALLRMEFAFGVSARAWPVQLGRNPSGGIVI